MNKLILYLAISLPCFVSGQPIITQAYQLETTEPFYIQTRVITTNTNLWQQGSNVIWNLPGPIDNTYTTVNLGLKKIDVAGQNPAFSQATHYSLYTDSAGNKTYKYYFSTPDSFCYLGYYTDDTKYTLLARWIDPQVDLKYPLTYNDSFDDYGYFYFTGWDKDLTDSSTAYAWTHTKTVADGYGAVNIGTTTVDSVLRVRVTTTRINKYYLAWDTALFQNDTTVNTTLYWLSNKFNRPVAQVDIYSYGFGTNKLSVQATYNANISLSVTGAVTNTAGLKLYPNPATTFLTIEHPNTVWETICISDISGKTLSTHNAGTGLISLSNLAQGVYIITAYDKQGNKSMAKFVKQ